MPRVLLAKQIKDIYTLADKGESNRAIARQLGLDRATVRRYLSARAPPNQSKPQTTPLAPELIDALQRTEARIEKMTAHLDDIVDALLQDPQDEDNRAAYLPLLHAFCKVLAEHRENHRLYSDSRSQETEGNDDKESFAKTLLEAFDAAELTPEQRRKLHAKLREGTGTTDK